MKYTHQRNLLTIDSKILKFDGEIKGVLELNEKYLIVRLLVDKNLKTSQNVFCVSDKGEIVWQAPFIRGHTPFGSAYTGMRLEKDGTLYLCNLIADMWVNPLTGEVLRKQLGR